MIQYLRFRMTDEMLQTELWENREQRSLFLCVPFESPHLHHQNRDKHLVRNSGLTNSSEKPPIKWGLFAFGVLRCVCK